MVEPTLQASTIEFDDVLIRLRRQAYYSDPDVFWADVLQAPVPLSSGTFRLDVEAQLELFRSNFAMQASMDQSFYNYDDPNQNVSEMIEQMGQELGRLGDELYSLLPDSLCEGFPHLIQYSLQKGRGIRLIIEARAGDQADRLLSLPWEIFFAQERHAYLARLPRFIVVRRLLDVVCQSPPRLQPLYHVLHVIADDPTYPLRDKFQDLSAMECQVIPRAITPQRYTLVANPGSVEQMEAKLGGMHILHFLGHGEVSAVNPKSVPRADTQRGDLKFINAEGRTQPLTGEQLQHRLAATSNVQLVVLNACHGGSTAAGNIALELTYSGLPFVVAMQGEIQHKAAELFTQAFYEALQRDERIDVAVAQGRAKIATGLPGAIDWCLPVLYTNVGLEEKGTLPQWGERLWYWFGTAAKDFIPRATLGVGGFLLVVGLLLLLSDAAPPPPNVSSLVRMTAWVGALPPFVTIAVYLSGQIKIPATWDNSIRAALIMRLLISASIGLGFSLFCLLWIGLTLFLSLGFWAMLSPAAQFLLLVPAFALSLLASYAQTIGHARAFITNAQVETPKFDWGDSVMVLGGYALMLGPLLAWLLLPTLMAPPLGTFLIGGLVTVVGYAMLYEN